jgi:hypothetical protein
MSEEILGSGTDVPVSGDVAPASTPAPVEKTLSQSEVDKIVHARTRDAAAKANEEGYQRAVAELSAKQPQPQAQTPPAAQQHGEQYLTAEQARQIYRDESQQVRQEAVFSQAMTTFVEKMEAGKSEYPDFEDVIAPLNLPAIKPIAYLASLYGNTSKIMYDLGKNPHKVGNILTLLGNPATVHLAQLEMQKLSASIEANKAATNTPSAKEPLSDITPSNVGAGSGEMTIADWRGKYRG